MATKKIAVAPKKEHPQKALPNILMRIVAVFAASGLSVLVLILIAGKFIIADSSLIVPLSESTQKAFFWRLT
jgi:hypothetical protein